MDMKSISLDKIKIAQYNPRKVLKKGEPDYEKIRKSIESFGLIDPLIVNIDMTLIAGHQRFSILMDLGETEANCVVVELDKKNEKLLNIALNKIQGEWDLNLLKDLLLELDTGEFDIGLTGFSAVEIEKLIYIPDFGPVDEDGQPRLDELKKVCCPECGYEFKA